MVTPEDLNETLSAESNPDVRPEIVTIREAGSIIETLSSDTSREIMAILSHEPTNAAEIADSVGISIQTTIYHLQKLRKTGLVQIVGSHYSEKGRLMDIYAPMSSTIVIEIEDSNAPKENSSSQTSRDSQSVRTTGFDGGTQSDSESKASQ